MKKVVISLFVALLATVGVKAQQIAVVSESGTTSMYQTLPDAIGGADPGSVIYLPGGGFQIADDVKITKKLTIIGIGHKANGENADGNTIISGNLFFDGGSSSSAVMGCYISGNVNVGNDGSSVNNVTVRYCNLNSMQVKNNTCTGTIVNQNYIRNLSNCGNAEVTFTNNIAHSICYSVGGIINHNIFTSYCRDYYISRGNELGTYFVLLDNCSDCTIAKNIFLFIRPIYSSPTYMKPLISNCVLNKNMCTFNLSDSDVNVSDWTDVFKNFNEGAVSPVSDFHFTNDYQEYSYIGPYSTESGSTGFSDRGMAPVPYILAKKVDAQTDASGKLNVKIRVKAGE